MNFTLMIFFVHVLITLLSLSIFWLLSIKYVKGKNKNHNVHKLTAILSLLAFFIFLDNFNYCFTFYLGLGISPELTNFFSDGGFQIIANTGIFSVLILLTYFLFDKRIEQMRKNEDELKLMQELNLQLERKAKEIELAHEEQQKKIYELEKFSEIAKEREAKMINLTNKIKDMETQYKKKEGKK